jgi:hypothetical protein
MLLKRCSLFDKYLYYHNTVNGNTIVYCRNDFRQRLKEVNEVLGPTRWRVEDDIDLGVRIIDNVQVKDNGAILSMVYDPENYSMMILNQPKNIMYIEEIDNEIRYER